MASQKLNIAIVGGGVCGLTLAIGLQKLGLKAHIYESTAKFGEIGAGLSLGSNALNILSEIGVYDEISKHIIDPRRVKMPGFCFVFGNVLQDPIHTTANEGDQASSATLRSVFLDTLVKFVDPAYTHFNKRCVSVTSSPDSQAQILHFKDGSTAAADVVLDASGIKSSLRRKVIASAETTDADTADAAPPGVSYSNIVSYRGLVRQERAQALGVDTSMWRSPTIALGKGQQLVIYPVNTGKVINVAGLVGDYAKPIGSVQLPPTQPLTEQVTTEELLADFPGSDFAPEVRELLKCIEKPSKWYINIVYPHLETYAKGRVALLGDAAHGMLPFLAAGAGQGMEDAYLLANLLSNPQTNIDNVEKVLQVYSDIRRPRSQRILDMSTQSGRFSHGHGPHGFTKEGLQQDLKTVEGWMAEAYGRSVNKDVDEAVEMLKANGVFA